MRHTFPNRPAVRSASRAVIETMESRLMMSVATATAVDVTASNTASAFVSSARGCKALIC